MKTSNLNNKILVIDDEFDVRETLSEAFEFNGYHTLTASNGAEALQILNDAENPAVILLDMMMPVMDGIEFLKVKEQRPKIAGIPTIAFSADGSMNVKVSGFNIANWFRKPVELDELLKAIERLM